MPMFPYRNNNQCSALISYISLCLGGVFYYLEVVNQLFFVIYKDGANHIPITLVYHKALSFSLLVYLVILAPVYYFYLKKYINIIYRFLLYFIIPATISLILWYFYIFRSYPIGSFIMSKSTYETFKYIMIVSYLSGLTAIMTLVTVVADCVINLSRKIIIFFDN